MNVEPDVRGRLAAKPDGMNASRIHRRTNEIELVGGEVSGRHDEQHPCIEHQIGHLAQTTQMLVPVDASALEIRVHSIDEISNAQEVDEPPFLEEPRLEGARETLSV